METEQYLWRKGNWQQVGGGLVGAAQLVLVFGARAVLNEARLAEIAARYPGAHLLGCSTAGEISDVSVFDETVVSTAVHFAKTTLTLVSETITPERGSTAVGRSLATRLTGDDLVHVLVLSDGLVVNGSELVAGFRAALPAQVLVTGGLAADGAAFQETRVLCDGPAQPGLVAAVGFYGKHLRVGHGSLGGWDSFGPDRLITRSVGNVLYELDGQPALALYKRYLGPHGAGLPATGLLFPLALRSPEGDDVGLVRTILAVNETDGSMTFAGDMPEGSQARLMKANMERLIEGAAGAALGCRSGLGEQAGELVVLISCVGRKLILQQRVEEEVERVREILGPAPSMTGFYSYGEISPYLATTRCELHNQTMTITTFAEA